MNTVTAGFALRFLVFWRAVLSDSFTTPSSARNQTADTCGLPSGPIVASVVTAASSRSTWVDGTEGAGIECRSFRWGHGSEAPGRRSMSSGTVFEPGRPPSSRRWVIATSMCRPLLRTSFVRPAPARARYARPSAQIAGAARVRHGDITRLSEVTSCDAVRTGFSPPTSARLPAPDDVWAQLEVSDQRLGEAVAEVVNMQISAGVDFINEGELTKGGHWTQYLAARLDGYEPAEERGGLGKLLMSSADWVDFDEFYLAVLQNGTLFEQSGSAPHVPEGAEDSIAFVEDWVCTGPISYRGQQALEREIALLDGRTRRPAGVRRVLDHDSAPQCGTRPHEGFLRFRRGAHLRHRRGDAGRVRSDRRRRVPGPGRRCLARRSVGPHRARDGARRVPQVLPDALRSPEPRAAQHPRGADPVPPLLGELARAALARSRRCPTSST